MDMLQNSNKYILNSKVQTYSPLDSSFILKMSWFEDGNILMLTFATGSIWAYYNVPIDVYSKFCKSISYGRYFNTNIRGKYTQQRVSYTEPEGRKLNE